MLNIFLILYYIIHGIGYNHDSNMTNDLLLTICSQLMWDMGNIGKSLVTTQKGPQSLI